MPSTVIVILPVEAFTDPFAEGSHYNIGSVGTHTLPRQEVSRKKAQANTVSVTKTILRRKSRLMAPVTQKLPEISELREVPKLPELRGPNIYPLVNSSIKKLFSYPTQSYKIAGRLEHFLANWRKITKDQKMLQTVSGCKVELFETPHQIKPPQAHKFSTPEKALTEKEIKELEEKGAIKQVSPVPRSILKQLVSQRSSEVFSFPVDKLHQGIQLSSVRLRTSTQEVHKAVQTSPSSPTENGNEAGDIRR